MNKYTIELVNGKQPPYGPIYTPHPVKPEILKADIKTHLKTGFIQPFKSFSDTLIFFDKKLIGNFCLCIDY